VRSIEYRLGWHF